MAIRQRKKKLHTLHLSTHFLLITKRHVCEEGVAYEKTIPYPIADHSLLSISLLTALVGCSSHSGSEDLGENKDTESYIERTYPEERSHDDAPSGSVLAIVLILRNMKTHTTNSVVVYMTDHFHPTSYSFVRVVPGHTAAYTPPSRSVKSDTSTGT